MDRLSLDFETASELDVTVVGTDAYARHPSTRVLMLGYAFNDDEPKLWQPHIDGPEMPAEVREALHDPEVIKSAWNASFERAINRHVLGMDTPVETWRDPMVLAHSLSMPGSLDQVGKIIRLDDEHQKDARGKQLIRLFSNPQKPTKKHPYRWRNWETDPEAWAEFCEYCIRDVVSEREIARRLSRWDMPPEEWELWFLDQRINERGVPLDPVLIRQALRMYERVQAHYLDQIKARTGLDNPGSVAQLAEWLRDHGYRWPDLQKATVEKAVKAEDTPAEVQEVLQLRLLASRTAPKKFAALQRASADDNRIRFVLQMNGAPRTGRWGGRKFQPQNLARPIKELEDPEAMAEAVEVVRSGDLDLMWMLYDSPMDVLCSLVRPAVRAPEGYEFAIADLSSIEYVVVGWQAECERTYNVLSSGLDAYKDFGVHLLGKPYDEITKLERTFCKPPVLGCGYRLGPGQERGDTKTGLLGYADSMGVAMSLADAERAVETYRRLYVAVKNFWYEIESAAKRVILKRVRTAEAGPLVFDRSGPFLRMRLPSGRYLYYLRPRLEDVKTPWGETRPTITYEGLDQDTRKWKRQSTHGGKMVENSTQAIARDILADGLKRAEARRLDVVLHVHDEIVALLKKSKARAGLEALRECMTEYPAWAQGMKYPMVLGASGFTSPFYTKD